MVLPNELKPYTGTIRCSQPHTLKPFFLMVGAQDEVLKQFYYPCVFPRFFSQDQAVSLPTCTSQCDATVNA